MARIIILLALMLSACERPPEGGMFYNGGGTPSPVVCENVTTFRIECRTVKNVERNARRDKKKDY